MATKIPELILTPEKTKVSLIHLEKLKLEISL